MEWLALLFLFSFLFLFLPSFLRSFLPQFLLAFLPSFRPSIHPVFAAFGTIFLAPQHGQNSDICETVHKSELFACLYSDAVRTPKNLPDDAQNPLLGRPWSARGAPFGRAWVRLGCYWALLERSSVPLEAWRSLPDTTCCSFGLS